MEGGRKTGTVGRTNQTGVTYSTGKGSAGKNPFVGGIGKKDQDWQKREGGRVQSEGKRNGRRKSLGKQVQRCIEGKRPMIWDLVSRNRAQGAGGVGREGTVLHSLGTSRG